jgi:hypothetical protein
MKENAMRKLNFFILILVTTFVTSCASTPEGSPVKSLEDYRMPTDVSQPADLTATAKTEIASSIPPADCPVTTSKDASFKAPEPQAAIAPWPDIFWYGTEGLWTALHDHGVWEGLPKNPDGYTQKIMWWSSLYVLKDELEPALVVSAQRLDGDAPPFKFHGATNAFAEDIGDAMLTGVNFPTEGCWEVTGQYKKSGLTFVVWIAP